MVTEIVIKGLGGIASVEAAIVADALRSVGYDVEVIDPDASSEPVESLRQRVSQYNSGANASDTYPCVRSKAKVMVKSIPWGG